ncbi:LrgB family protein [Aeromonas simiae]|uniref:LrgB family protein n=1 Tax=Aeromonas simiae TaxID=218936 RepID=UPI00266D796A|nr:LrgB family protein [Aeromonas simiae]MDO2948542.1 LrgB family protein [Aeromonas simiae]MDO2951452.1 LrgB family protein [Aeromonas simiae]MDO2955925.1 LrgB family protein [Aeromonas simiae]
MMFWLALPLTVVLYSLTRTLYHHLSWPVINPVLLPTLVIVALLLMFHLPLEQYQQGTTPLTILLEPAVVALALPLYQQARQIRAKLKPILLCCLLSVVISISTTLLIGHLLGADTSMLASIATKSITTPLAMSVSQSLGGIPAIAAAIVVVVGVTGALIGFPLLKLLRVTDPEAQGLAMGACAHAVGTAASAEQGITQGAFSSLAMVVCGILTALAAPLLFALYHLLGA